MGGPLVESQHVAVLAVLALVAFTAAVIVGARVASRREPPTRRPIVYRYHRRLTAAAVGLGVLHVVVALSVAGRAPTIGIVLGVVALILGAIPVLAWGLRRHLPGSARVGLHRLAYAVVPFAVVHAVIVHSGPMAPVEPLLYGLFMVVVVAVGVERLVTGRPGRGDLAAP